MINVLTSAYKSIVIETKEGSKTISEGMTLRFADENAEIVEGGLIKISGKKDKTTFQIVPTGAVKHEIWHLVDIAAESIEIL